MRTEILDEGSVVDSNQHGPQSFASLPHTRSASSLIPERREAGGLQEGGGLG
jgi:hypothetical protein